jgi:hypothetical protein
MIEKVCIIMIKEIYYYDRGGIYYYDRGGIYYYDRGGI